MAYIHIGGVLVFDISSMKHIPLWLWHSNHSELQPVMKMILLHQLSAFYQSENVSSSLEVFQIFHIQSVWSPARGTPHIN